MIDKEVAIASIAFLFIILGAYIFFFQQVEVGPGTVAVECSSNPEQTEIFLPEPITSTSSLEDVLLERRQVKIFSETPLSLQEVSNLMWAGQGITDKVSGSRSAPSTGDIYPIELYILPIRISGASCGIYHYVPAEHKLVLMKEGKFTSDIRNAAYGQTWLGDSAAVIIMSAVPERTAQKYGEKGAERYIDMEAGHISQNILLQAVSLDLGAASVGDFSQDYVDSLLGIDGYKEKSVYLTIVGKKKE